MSDNYLRTIDRLAESALVQARAVSRCTDHESILIYNANAEAERVAFHLASVWLRNEVGFFIQQDLRDAIQKILGRAERDGCPECSREA